MPSPALTSRLDAVNVVLSAAGEQPVSSLTPAVADASNADNIIEEVSRSVQSVGWHFNTDEDVPLSPDNDGLINLPANVLKIDVENDASVDVVQRGVKLYDRKARSYVFSRPVKADIVYFLPFDELPEQARYYIAVKAARMFHDRFIGAEAQHRFTTEDETRAQMALVAVNLDNADINLFRRNAQLSRLTQRR